jgi:hypothetical protein
MSRVFGRKGEQLTGGLRKLYNEGLHNLYSSPNAIIKMIKLRKLGWIRYVARTTRARNSYNI